MKIHIAPLGELPSEVRTILLLGSRTSDHLRELARIAEWRGRAAYRLESEAELQPRWFSGVEAVGIVLGATSLQPLLERVLTRLKEIESVQHHGMLEGLAR